ncbi:unnamed protein product [Victoria cruziana]
MSMVGETVSGGGVVKGVGKTALNSGWVAARSTEVSRSGVKLTTTNPPSGDEPPWMEAVVPGTVLGTLLKNKLVGDPFYGLENEAIIDIADSGREHYTFWFFTTFDCSLNGNQHVDLNFRGVNYSAEVYLNGHKKDLGKGMFLRHSLDVTDIVNMQGKNMLAVLVYPPDNPGKIPLEGGQGGDHEIGKDVAAQYVEGWDWMAPIRDRNTGIWDEVSISVTGPVKIHDPHLVSSFFDNYKRVYLHSTVEFENRSTWPAECSLSIQVSTNLEEGICLVEHLQTQALTIPASKQVQYTFPPLFFYRPNLWWPNGMGKQSLYNVEVLVDVKGHGESDTWKHYFGFRRIDSSIDPTTGGRLFRINGQPVFIRGGNWILSDGLLRLSETRYKTDIKFHADMNFNMIRCWGGGIAERPEFYHYCDVYGLLVWQEFWITGDCDGRGIPVSNPNGPLDHDLFLKSARDIIKLLRNHASLALWVGGNEQTPPNDINTALKNDLKLHPLFQSTDESPKSVGNFRVSSDDPSQYLDGTRIYIPGSLWDGFADGKGGFTDATIRATMPPEGWKIPLFRKVDGGFTEEVPNPIWKYHKYIPYSKPGKVHDQIELYGTPKDLDDFCEKAQLANYVQYRALLEGWTSRMWTKYTGVLIWKTQNPWTGLRGQFYDHLLDQTAGFYGCRSAAEPIHVQLNLDTYFIEVINTTSTEITGLAIEVSVWDLEAACPYYKIINDVSLSPKRAAKVAEMTYPKTKNAKPVYFLLLKLFRQSDKSILSRNFYWLHQPGGDYRLLEGYRTKKVPLQIKSRVTILGTNYEVQMHIKNLSEKRDSRILSNQNPIGHSISDYLHNDDNDFDPRSMDALEEHTDVLEESRSFLSRMFRGSSKMDKDWKVMQTGGSDSGVAFFLHFSVHASREGLEPGGDTRILPVHYSDNYFSLVPGETMTINISFEVQSGISPRVTLRGWNHHYRHSISIGAISS